MQMSAEGRAASVVLKARREAIAERVTSLYFEAHPQLEQRWKGARQKCTEDNRTHLDYLCDALSFGHPSLFTEYAVWAAVLLARLKIGGEALALNLELLRSSVALELDDAGGAMASRYLDAAVAKITGTVPDPPSNLEGSGPIEALARNYLAALLRGERDTASRLIHDEAERGTAIQVIYLLVFQRVLREVGRLWQTGQIGVAQEHYCSACTQFIMSQLYGRVFTPQKNGRRLVSAAVAGDLHEIGARMVSDFFEMEGWDTFYLGANTPIAGILQQVADRTPDVLAISATLSSHIHAVADLIAATRAAENPPRILVGGPPFNSVPGLWEQVGADGYAHDAAAAVALAEGWFA